MQYVFKYLLNKHLSRIPNNKHCPLLNKHAFSLCWLYIVNINAVGGTQISAVYEDNVCLLMISAEFPLQQDITELGLQPDNSVTDPHNTQQGT